MPTPTPGTIPALTPYQPAALHLTGQEAVEIVSSLIATSAISGSMLITDIVGKAPSVIPQATPTAADVLAFYQGSSGTPRSAALSQFAIVIASVQRSVTSVAQLPIVGTDHIININATSDLVISVPLASSRNGVVLTFKNIVGSHFQTLIRTGSDTFDGQASYPLTTGASVTLMPFNDGTNQGYGII